MTQGHAASQHAQLLSERYIISPSGHFSPNLLPASVPCSVLSASLLSPPASCRLGSCGVCTICILLSSLGSAQRNKIPNIMNAKTFDRLAGAFFCMQLLIMTAAFLSFYLTRHKNRVLRRVTFRPLHVDWETHEQAAGRPATIGAIDS